MILKIHKGETKAEVTMENDREIHKRVIDGIFGLFGIRLPEREKVQNVKYDPVVKFNVRENQKAPTEELVNTVSKESLKEPCYKGGIAEKENAETQAKPRPRQLPLLGVNKESFTMMERAKCKTKVQCPSCGKENTVSLPFGFRYTFCPECNEKLFIRPAGNAWGEVDEEGNIYVAREIFEKQIGEDEKNGELH